MNEQAREIRRQAKAWMVSKNIRVMDIQAALEMDNHVLISDTLRGQRNNRQVLQYLLAIGCPAEHLALPRDMRGAA